MNKLTILNYHILYEEQLSNIAKDEIIYAKKFQEFQKHIKYLYDKQYRAISLEEYLGIDQNNYKSEIVQAPLESNLKPVIITFDDGHVSQYISIMTAKEYGFPIIFFVTVEKIGTQNYLTWQQLRQMRDEGMLIMSHTMTHPFLSDIPHSQIRWELKESKKILEQQLGKPVHFLSLPGGRCSKIVKEIAKEVGYKGICTSIIGYNYPNTDPYSLKRWTITGNMSFSTFQSIVEGKKSTLLYYKSRQFLLNGMKKIMGNKLYANIHKEITSGIKAK
ncbi:MAG: polysaccharide deacetylase family protein [bacterium]